MFEHKCPVKTYTRNIFKPKQKRNIFHTNIKINSNRSEKEILTTHLQSNFRRLGATGFVDLICGINKLLL